MASSLSRRRILITGPPGIGKTTLVTKICMELSRRQKLAVGFYTEEVRQNGQRIGFDVVTLSGNRGSLARIGTSTSDGYRVGKYTVNLKSFEAIALPIFKQTGDAILVIDEIGKMELFSKSFQHAVEGIFLHAQETSVLATIPITKFKPLPFLDTLRSQRDVQIINVSRENRNDLVETIVKSLTE